MDLRTAVGPAIVGTKEVSRFKDIAGTIVFGIGLSGILPMIVVRTGSVIFGAGLVWLGVSLRKRSSR